MGFGCLLPVVGNEVNREAMRLLRDQCVSCHKPGKAKGGLLLTSAEKLKAGGDSGEVVVAGKAKESLLYQSVLEDADSHMPPKKQLSEKEMALLKTWIDAGAVWDATVFDEAPIPKKVKFSTLPVAYQPVLALEFAPDEKRLAVAQGKQIKCLDLTQPEKAVVLTLEHQPEAVQSLAWSRDGKWLVAGGYQRVLVWDVASGKLAREITGFLLGNVTALAIAVDGKSVFVADGESGSAGFLHQVDLEQGKTMATWKAHEDTIYGMRLSPKGDRLLSGAADKLAKLWDTGSRKLVATFEGHTNHVLAVAFNRDATQIATAGADREIKVWDTASREQDVTLGDKKNTYSALYWTADGKALGVVSDKGGGNVYTELKKHTGEQSSETAKQRKLVGVDDTLTSLGITRDGKTVYAGGFTGKVYAWDAASGKLTATITP